MEAILKGYSRAAEILLIEDNPGDVELIQEALQSGKVLNRISVAGDGEAAVGFLNRERGYEDAPRPDLVLLDLNIPKKNGFEVLAEIRKQSGSGPCPGRNSDQLTSRPGHCEELQSPCKLLCIETGRCGRVSFGRPLHR